MKHILVLGGTGFVGAHVCEKLVRAGFRVSVPTRRAVNARKVQHLPGLTVLECNVHDEAALTKAMVGVDAVEVGESGAARPGKRYYLADHRGQPRRFWDAVVSASTQRDLKVLAFFRGRSRAARLSST